MKESFDYEKKVWSASPMLPNCFYIQYLHFLYAAACLSKLKEGSRVLDLGCGGGSLAAALAKDFPGLIFTGVDISKNAIKDAQKFSTDNLNFIHIDSERNLPFSNGYFEAVLLVDVLEHISRPAGLLARAGRVLVKGGYLYISVPVEGAWWCLHFWARRLGWQGKLVQSGHVQNFTPRKVRELLLTGGFNIIESRWGFHLFSQVLDIAYSLFWLARRRLPKMSLEGYRQQSYSSFKWTLLNLATKPIFLIMNLESLIFKSIPAMGWHLTARKS